MSALGKQHLGGDFCELRPAWSAEQLPGLQRVHREILFWKTRRGGGEEEEEEEEEEEILQTGAGEMDQQLRAPVALAEELGSSHITHTISNFSFWRSDVLFWPL